MQRQQRGGAAIDPHILRFLGLKASLQLLVAGQFCDVHNVAVFASVRAVKNIFWFCYNFDAKLNLAGKNGFKEGAAYLSITRCFHVFI